MPDMSSIQQLLLLFNEVNGEVLAFSKLSVLYLLQTICLGISLTFSYLH